MANWIQKKNIILIFYSIVIFAVPFLIFSGNVQILGGDDTQLFYFIPHEGLNNWIQNLSNNNLIGTNRGFFSHNFHFFFLHLILFFKFFFNEYTQLVLLSLNSLLGFIFSYFFFKELLIYFEKKNYLTEISALNASAIYSTSLLIYVTLYSHLLVTSIYLISIFPAFFFSILRSSRTKNFSLPILCAIYTSFFPILPMGIAWVYGIFISSFILIIFFSLKIRLILINILIFVLIYFVINLHWIVYWFETLFDEHLISSVAHGSDNINIIYNVASVIQIFKTLFFLPSDRMIRSENLIELINYIIIFYVPLFIILIYPLFSDYTEKFNKKFLKFYYLVALIFLLTLFFYSIKIDIIGFEPFLFIYKNFPLMTFIRNSYDKLALPLSFYYSFLLLISLCVIPRKKIFFINWYLFIILILNISLIIYGKQLLLGHFGEDTKGNKVQFLDFDKDYKGVINFFKNLEDKNFRVLSFPINNFNWENINHIDQGRGFLYRGGSPFLLLSGYEDIAGLYGFLQDTDEIKNIILSKDQKNFEKLLKLNGIKYLVVNKKISYEIEKRQNSSIISQYSLIHNLDSYNRQLTFFENLVTKKVFSNKNYDIFEIKNNKIIYTSKNHDIKNLKIFQDGYKFLLDIQSEEKINLHLTKPYSKYWKIDIKNNTNIITNSINYEKINLWEINNKGKALENIEVRIIYNSKFKPPINSSNSLILTILIISLCIIYNLKKNYER